MAARQTKSRKSWRWTLLGLALGLMGLSAWPVSSLDAGLLFSSSAQAADSRPDLSPRNALHMLGRETSLDTLRLFQESSLEERYRREQQAVLAQAQPLTAIPNAMVQIAAFFFSGGRYIQHRTGSGVVVHPTGTILTNVHVLHDVEQGCTITAANPSRADLLVILVPDPENLGEPPQPQFAVDLRGLTREALARTLPAESLPLDLAVVRINKRFTGEAFNNLEDLVQAVQKGQSLPLTNLDQPLDLTVLPLWDTAAMDEGQDVQLAGYPAVSPLPRLTFTEGPILGKRAEGTLLVDRAFATFGFSGGALVEKHSGLLVGILCGGQAIDTPAGKLILAVGRALDTQAQEFLNKVPEVKRLPVPHFAFQPEFPKPGAVITFDASASFDPDGRIAKYEWDFNGDGVPDATGAKVQQVFQDNARVTLFVADNENQSAQRTQRVILDRRAQTQCGTIQIGNRTFPTIQAAIEAAQLGETITVSPGTCQENLIIRKSLTLRGVGRDQTILLGDGRAPVIRVEVEAGRSQAVVTIERFAIRNGRHALQALGNVKLTLQESDLRESVQQGVDVAFGADVTLIDNRLSDNDEEGFVLEGGTASLRGNTIVDNGDKGVLIKNLRTHDHVIAARATLAGNQIEHNRGSGGFFTQQAQAQIQGKGIYRNQQGGLVADEGADFKLIGTEVSENIGDGVRLFDATVEINENTVISKNSHYGMEVSGHEQAQAMISERPSA